MSYNRKPIPESVLIFGASGHIGGPLATFLTREAPSIRLRLATHSAEKADSLGQAFPAAETVVADYADATSIAKAVDGMHGVFVITSPDTDERQATNNLIDGLNASGTLVQLIRIVGYQPEFDRKHIPESLREVFLNNDHRDVVKRLFDESGLPVTYLNSGATFMDNFIRYGMVEGLRRERKLIWPERLIPWIDPRDIAEVAGRLFLSDNHRHIGQLHTMNNGHDLMRFHEVADLMSEVWGEPISYDGSKETFLTNYAMLGPFCHFLWEFFQYEQDNEVVWARNDFVERTLGRKPTTLRDWLIEHRDALLGPPAAPAS